VTAFILSLLKLIVNYKTQDIVFFLFKILISCGLVYLMGLSVLTDRVG